ncbi:MAG TPA: hypothetical protein VFJ76_07270 [Solirubrobacterales bacterium]|nr:hypothetical protein [Solirubrobacterales bacterium]
MLLAISLTCALTFPTSLAAFVKSFDLIFTFGFFGIAALRFFMPTLFLRPPLDAAASAIAPPAVAIAAPPATSGTFALLAALPTPLPALLALSPTPPTAWRTASIGVEPPLEPLLDPVELGDLAFGFDFDFDELDDFGLARFVALGFDDFDFADFGFEALGLAFDLDCDFGFAFDLLDAPALFEAGCFLDLVSAIFLSPRGVPY